MPAGVPISIILLKTLTAFGGLVAVRVARRAAWERSMSRQRAARNSGKGRSAVLLVGAGSAGVMAVREIRSRGEHDMDLRVSWTTIRRSRGR